MGRISGPLALKQKTPAMKKRIKNHTCFVKWRFYGKMLDFQNFHSNLMIVDNSKVQRFTDHSHCSTLAYRDSAVHNYLWVVGKSFIKKGLYLFSCSISIKSIIISKVPIFVSVYARTYWEL